MHVGIVLITTSQKVETLAKVFLDSLLLIDRLDLTHVVLLAQFNMLLHVVESVRHDVLEQARNLVS